MYTKYSLSTSMTDRANFDQMVRNYLYEVKFIGTPEEAVKLFSFEEGATEVDDIEEAKTRIEAVAKEIILENFADKLEEIEETIVIFDTGCETFGEYANGMKAAEAVRNSNPDWWAMQEAPTFEYGTLCNKCGDFIPKGQENYNKEAEAAGSEYFCLCRSCDYELNHR